MTSAEESTSSGEVEAPELTAAGPMPTVLPVVEPVQLDLPILPLDADPRKVDEDE